MSRLEQIETEPADVLTVRLGTGGRIVIPARVRARLGWGPDEHLRLKVHDDGLVVESVVAGWRRARDLFQKYDRGRGSMVDELIAERRAEARREDEER